MHTNQSLIAMPTTPSAGAKLNYLSALLVFLSSLIFSTSSFAHGADDHEHAAAPTNTIQMAPRAAAQTEDFELLAVLQGRHLVIYLDDFNTNQAIANAQIEISSNTNGQAFKAIAKQTSPGVYVIDLNAGVFEKAGKYPLTITVQAGELGDIMTTQLDIPEQHEDEIATSGFTFKTWMWAALASLLLIAFGIFSYQRKARISGI
jgi:hypothetical protein